ncbi:MAG: M24 family metallopeptidase, partial [Terracidiphilus sp.]
MNDYLGHGPIVEIKQSTLSTDVQARWPYSWEEREKVLELEFTLSEYESRIARIYEEMGRMRLDALFVHGGPASKSNLRYASGWESFFGDSFLLLSKTCEPVLVTNSILHGEPMHSNIQVTWVKDFRPCLAFGTTFNQQSPVDYLVAALAECGALGKRVGYVASRQTSAQSDREIRGKMAGTELVDASAVLTKLRRIKSPAEIEVLRTLAAAVSLGMEAAIKAAVPGNTEHDVAAAMYNVVMQRGMDLSPLGMRIQAGRRSSMKNVLPKKGKVIREGEIVSIDSSVEFYGYQSDHARSVVAGRASAAQIRLLEACADAQEAGLRAAGPGVK